MEKPFNKNKSENSTGKGFSPPSGKMSPPAAGAHAPKDVHRIPGGHNGGNQSAALHAALRKPKGY